MDIEMAKTAGFCFGVQRAMDKVYALLEEHPQKQIYTLGPIIHNEEVVKDLEARGVRMIEEEDLEHIQDGIIVIRSHGISEMLMRRIQNLGLEILDVTCPFVSKIHRHVYLNSAKGHPIIIAGNSRHPEVEGIMGWCRGPVYVVETPEDVDKLPQKAFEGACIVAQTTFNHDKFKVLVENISKRGYDSNVLNTICNATQERQIEAKSVAGKVDGMLVIGGKNSSNTQKLYEICKKECENTFYIQTKDDIDLSWFQDAKKVGITAGASTPKNIIEEVQTNVRTKF